jgi:diguanylate cyclase (GGDEF)-like protein
MKPQSKQQDWLQNEERYFKMDRYFSELLRIDPLTGCKNYLGFLETLTLNSLPDGLVDERSRFIGRKYRINAFCFSAIMFVDMNSLSVLNKSKGLAYGDSALRWMGILLREESNREVYRLGGDDFAVLLKLGTREEHLALVQRILKRMDLEAKLLGFPDTAADVALIFFDQKPTSLDTVLMQMGEAMDIVKNNRNFGFMLFDPTDFKIHLQSPETRRSNSDTDVSHSIRWLATKNIYQVLDMGRTLDEIQQEAYTDTISGLPNLKAARLNIEKAIQNSMVSHKVFSILMIDGDNIRTYNGINYAAGDEMIRDMSFVFKENLRPTDFVARWRVGDEFIVILPDTAIEGAKIIGERLRLAVKEASRSWRFPVTISIGIASCPTHGDCVDTLIDKVEAANKRAKEQGKNQLIVAD